MQRLYATRTSIEAGERHTGFDRIKTYFKERELVVFPREGQSCKPE